MKKGYFLLGSVLGLGLGVVGSNAQAGEGDPFSFTIGQSFTYDDNILRRPDGDTSVRFGSDARSDIVSRTYAQFHADIPVSLQKFLVDLDLSHYMFNRYSALDHDAYSASGKWLWQAGRNWRGDLVLQHAQSQTGFEDLTVSLKNKSTAERLMASANYWWHPDWAVGAGAGYLTTENSNTAMTGSDNRSTYVDFGVIHKRPTGNEFEARYRHTDTTYPNKGLFGGAPVDNSFTQDDLRMVLRAWRLTGASVLDGYVGYYRRNYSDFTARDFSAPMFKLGLGWSPDPRWLINTSIRKEVTTIDDVNPGSVDTKALAIALSWLPTAKIGVDGGLEYAIRDYEGDLATSVAGAPRREDKVRTARLGAVYKQSRALQFNVSMRHERRNSNIAGVPYKANAATAGVQFTF